MAKENIYLQGCKHTLCRGDICLGNWEKWRALLLVLSPTFHIDLQASLQSCFLLNFIMQKERTEIKDWRRKDIWAEKTCGQGDGDYLLYPSLLPQTTQVWEDLQQLGEQRDKLAYFWWKTVTPASVIFFVFAWLNMSWKRVASARSTFQVLDFIYCTSALC